MAEIPGTPGRADTPARRVTPRRVDFDLEDQVDEIPEDVDIVPRVEVPSPEEFQTPEESPRRPQRTRRAPAKFDDFVME